jgi:thiol-disulfide isomerase/thioredoxin
MKKTILIYFSFLPLFIFGQVNVGIPANVQQWLNQEINKIKKNGTSLSISLPKSDKSNIKQLPSLESSIYVDDFFNEKPAYLIGYIKNYDAASESFFLRIIAEDLLSGKASFPLSINIMPDGRFKVKIPNPHPQYNYLQLGAEEIIRFYIKPGQTLGMVIDLKSTVNKVEFQGESAQVNENLKRINSKVPALNPYFVYGNGVVEMTPQKFTEEYTRQYKNTQKKLQEYISENPHVTNAAEVAMFDNMIMYSTKMLEYSIKKSMTEKVPLSFYSFFNEIPLDNPQLLAGSQSGSMIDRLQYIIQDKLGQQNGLPANVTRAIVTKPDSLNQLVYKQMLTYLEQEEKLLKDSFQLKNSLLIDILKLHSFSTDLSGLPATEKAPYSTAVKDQINHPFLKRQVDKLIMLDSIVSGYKAFELSKGKVRDFFNEVIAKHKGKYVVVDFWGTDCGFCIEEIQNTFSLREKYKDSPDIDFVFITGNSISPSEKLYEKFVSDQRLYNSYRLQTQLYDAIRNTFMFNGIPHFALVDKTGKIVSTDFSIYRAMPESMLESLLKKTEIIVPDI